MQQNEFRSSAPVLGPASDVSGRLLGDLVQRVFRGSRAQLLCRLVEARKLTAEERTILEQILKEERP
jgi:BlaI family transcriptional regulator, penicillinase repressor